MTGRIEGNAYLLSLSLAAGDNAKVQGEQFLAGVPLRYMEVDGVPVRLPDKPVREVPAVRVTHQDGTVSLFVTSSIKQAEALLARAQEILESQRGG